jgi:hypothetical protein
VDTGGCGAGVGQYESCTPWPNIVHCRQQGGLATYAKGSNRAEGLAAWKAELWTLNSLVHVEKRQGWSRSGSARRTAYPLGPKIVLTIPSNWIETELEYDTYAAVLVIRLSGTAIIR